MNLTPQHQRILALHSDGEWHCSTEIEFIRDQRKRISELNHGGYEFESLKCNICAPHKHNSNLLMRRLVKRIPKELEYRVATFNETTAPTAPVYEPRFVDGEWRAVRVTSQTN